MEVLVALQFEEHQASGVSAVVACFFSVKRPGFLLPFYSDCPCLSLLLNWVRYCSFLHCAARQACHQQAPARLVLVGVLQSEGSGVLIFVVDRCISMWCLGLGSRGPPEMIVGYGGWAEAHSSRV